jgi:hypothetical protein
MSVILINSYYLEIIDYQTIYSSETNIYLKKLSNISNYFKYDNNKYFTWLN